LADPQQIAWLSNVAAVIAAAATVKLLSAARTRWRNRAHAPTEPPVRYQPTRLSSPPVRRPPLPARPLHRG